MPSRLGRWLETISRIDGFGLAETALPHNEEGKEARHIDWTPDGSAIRCVIYEPGYCWSRPVTPQVRARDEPLRLPPPLLEPMVRREAVGDERPILREEAAHRRPWRVAPAAEVGRPPGWVIGSLVHEALAAWRFPGNGFRDWATARASQYGITDARPLSQVVDDTSRLLMRLRAHPLYDDLERAERRHHEVPYSLKVDGQIESGVIDLLYKADGTWTIVEFKTYHVSNAAHLGALLSCSDFLEQAQRYRRAVRVLLRVAPRCHVCFLDYAGTVHLASVPVQ